MRTFKQNVVVLEDSDRIEIRFTPKDLDHLGECSIYINPEREIVMVLGGIKIVAIAVPAPEIWGVFYFPKANAVISPTHPDAEESDFGVYLCDDEGMAELEHTTHQDVHFLLPRP